MRKREEHLAKEEAAQVGESEWVGRGKDTLLFPGLYMQCF